MSEESELVANLERGYSHPGTTVVRDHVTGAMASFTPVRGSKMKKWICVFMDPVKKEFEHLVADDDVRTIVEHIYAKYNGWQIVSVNVMPGHVCAVCRQEDGQDVWYVDAPGHRQAVPNGYAVTWLAEEPGQQKAGWYYNRPNDDTDEGPFTEADAAAAAAWEDLEG